MHVHAQRQGQSFRQLQASVERLTQDGAPQGGEVRRVRSRVVSLPEVARIRGNILGSPALPEVERQRGKQHGWKAGGDQRCRENRPARPAWQG